MPRAPASFDMGPALVSGLALRFDDRTEVGFAFGGLWHATYGGHVRFGAYGAVDTFSFHDSAAGGGRGLGAATRGAPKPHFVYR